ncbi:MAG: hypothetical protein LC737_07015, partial [Chloroflexi bacterium]|nr:hypothetical protein [Chloroflexota bacterium]
APLRASRNIEFSLSAERTGNFQFSATLNGIPHIRIAARAGVDVGGNVASAGLTITTTRTVCRAQDPIAARAEISAAGAQLQTAMNALQNPPPATPGTTPPSTTQQLQDVGSAIYAVYQAVDKAQKPCEQTPVATFEFGARTPLTTPSMGTPPPSYIGATATFNF